MENLCTAALRSSVNGVKMKFAFITSGIGGCLIFPELEYCMYNQKNYK